MKRILSALVATTLCSCPALAGLYDTKVNGVRLYDRFVKQGVPSRAVERVFEFLDVNADKTVSVKHKVRGQRTYMSDRKVKIKKRYAGVIDFTKPSDERRFYVMDLKTGEVNVYFVAHGRNSGVVTPSKFSNVDGSKMSSLGLYLSGSTYVGKHGESLNLYGLEETNSKAAHRDIVMHGADYVSAEYAESQGRLGRSWGCPAVATTLIKKMIATFEEGNVIYAYQKDLMANKTSNPEIQVVDVGDNKPDVDLDGEEETLRKNQGQSSGLSDNDDIPIPLPRPDFLGKPVTVPQAHPDLPKSETGDGKTQGTEGEKTTTDSNVRPEVEGETDTIGSIIKSDAQESHKSEAKSSSEEGQIPSSGV